ncbi:hypothetical protein DB31_7764 [Hyalangium minutum]|uniref:Uncharacterized protein n=1 Tax=Hyalangium minutum TaxID=394096 RepID=A0A085WLG4_9BACT|nr:hypothetical protein DB31_7764 [Hyalangium minutum]
MTDRTLWASSLRIQGLWVPGENRQLVHKGGEGISSVISRAY